VCVESKILRLKKETPKVEVDMNSKVSSIVKALGEFALNYVTIQKGKDGAYSYMWIHGKFELANYPFEIEVRIGHHYVWLEHIFIDQTERQDEVTTDVLVSIGLPDNLVTFAFTEHLKHHADLVDYFKLFVPVEDRV